MVAPNTRSSTAGPGGRNKTFTAVSTNIIITVAGEPVGAIQSISIDESRDIAMIDEVGTDGHIDSVPKSSTNVSVSCERVRYDNLRILAAFSRPYIHVHSQRIPFDIELIDRFAGEDPNTSLVTVIKNCWVKKVSYKYDANDFVISENMDLEAETIYTTLGANNPAVPGAAGGRSIPINSPDAIERSADVGGRRGSLDAAGLLNVIDNA
jgi:hypothetical protein